MISIVGLELSKSQPVAKAGSEVIIVGFMIGLDIGNIALEPIAVAPEDGVTRFRSPGNILREVAVCK